MCDFEVTLAEATPLGVVSGEVIRLWAENVPDINERIEHFLNDSKPCRSTPGAGYIKVGNEAVPVRSQQLALIVATSKVRFEHRFSLQETADLLVRAGIKITKAGVGMATNRVMEALGITELALDKEKIIRASSLADIEAAAASEKKRLARQVATGKMTKDEFDKQLGKTKKPRKNPSPESPQESSKEADEDCPYNAMDEDFAGREIIYEPTPKQAEFHSASERIVLYGGAAGKPHHCLR